jgi:hypothetical protein
MFELGRTYRFRMWEPSGDGGTMKEFSGSIVEVSLPLLRVNTEMDGETILNAGSASFVSARLLG